MTFKFRRFLTVSIALSAAALASVSSAADAPQDLTHLGRASVYGNLKDSSLEAISTSDRLLGLLTHKDQTSGKIVATGESSFAPTQ
ncbi:MAG TPA: hypothetical protein VGC79_35550, partial [Polyangiaceae bacterium]